MNKAKRHLYIEVSKGGYRPFEPDKEEKQRLTILDNGLVWFTTYGLNTESIWQYKAMRKERHRISAEQANEIIDKALVLIKDDKVQDELFVMECDAEPDTITVVDTDGKNALDRGLYYRYEEQTEDCSAIKGKVDFKDYFTRKYPNGQLDKFQCIIY